MTQTRTRTFDEINREARPYPANLLADCETGLCLFAAAFQGHNDAIHFARNDLLTWCCDTDEAALHVMADVYPLDWSWIHNDAWTFGEMLRKVGVVFDAVSVDPFTGDQMTAALASLDLWASLARKVVTVGIADGMDYVVPDGWAGHFYPRTEVVHWLVLTR